MRTTSFSVDAGSVLRQAHASIQNDDPEHGAIGLLMGLGMIREGLISITERAIALGDPELLAILERLGCASSDAA